MITKATLWADPNALEIVLGSYRVGNASRLVDPTILAMTQEYRRLASARMVALEPKDIDERMPDDAYHVSRKIDGEFTMLVWRHGQLMTINPGGTVRMGMPWHEEAISLLKKAKIDDALIAGEMYGSSSDDRRPRIHDVLSMSRLPRDQAELDRIGFAAFDVVSLQGTTLNLPFTERWKKLESIFQKGKKAHLVESVWVKHPKEMGEYVEQWIHQQGAEGIVARSDTAGSFKIKLRHELDLAVLGFTESTGDRQGMLHDLLLGICRHDGTLQVVSRVGGGFTEDQRREMLSDLKDMVVDSQYTEVNSDHVAYQMVKPQWVVEISCLDVLSQTTRGAPVQRMVLDYVDPAKRYEVVRPLPLATSFPPSSFANAKTNARTKTMFASNKSAIGWMSLGWTRTLTRWSNRRARSFCAKSMSRKPKGKKW